MAGQIVERLEVEIQAIRLSVRLSSRSRGEGKADGRASRGEAAKQIHLELAKRHRRKPAHGKPDAAKPNILLTCARLVLEDMERDELMANMRGRIERCRRLARNTLDLQVAQSLRDMADEVEADLRRIIAEQNQIPPAPQA